MGRKRHPGHPIDDPMHPAWHGTSDPEKVLKSHIAGMEKHIQLHPETAYLFCEHGAYVGANGVLKDLFCRFCKEECDNNSDDEREADS